MDGGTEGRRDSGREGLSLGGTATVRNKENEMHPRGFLRSPGGSEQKGAQDENIMKR